MSIFNQMKKVFRDRLEQIYPLVFPCSFAFRAHAMIFPGDDWWHPWLQVNRPPPRIDASGLGSGSTKDTFGLGSGSTSGMALACQEEACVARYQV